MSRLIDYDGRQWRLSELARAYNLRPATLHSRINRFGETTSGIRRALATGLLTLSQAGQRGASSSPWYFMSRS